MRKISVTVLALMLGGCASVPAPRPSISHKAPAAKQAVKPVEQPTPNQTVKRRWFKGFKIKLLHNR